MVSQPKAVAKWATMDEFHVASFNAANNLFVMRVVVEDLPDGDKADIGESMREHMEKLEVRYSR